MGFLQVALALATFLCSLVAGFLFAFAVVVMPGIGNLNNREFIRAFQAIDGIIQNNQPLFMVVWLGSLIALVVATALGIGYLDAVGAWLLIISTLAYLLGVQLPTFTINIPLNNRLQSLNVDAMDEVAQEAAREAFEVRWNRWNAIRTVIACLVSALLVVLIFRY
ncbi:DUF1772 domain-containing protein [Marinobacter sp. 71-i]|uniref:DUF1772 domain-containing protein n=1 Tax=Marinobacter iranensis TaxID=2962607 RepID=A0ABT5YDH0_9GAMM|nr:DUF1772 domain-containing protein [Marinobacter iranensis]MDF0751730.1 DUF1772 domain-containing protein [Marinobacter iranensis]